jgi:uncharacterized protein (DUF362 family)
MKNSEMSRVVFRKIMGGMEIEAAIYEILSQSELNLHRNEKIILKPNFSSNNTSETGCTTHLEIIEAVIRYLKDYGCSILLAESDPTNADFDEIRKGLHLDRFEKQYGARILNMSKANQQKTTIRGECMNFTFPLSTDVLECDKMINLPVLKTHVWVGASAGIKNLFGMICEKNKVKWHIYLHEILLGMLRQFKPAFTIVDAISAMEGMGPIFGRPVGCKVLIAGADPVAVDLIACRFMEQQVIPGYLKKAMKTGFSTRNAENIVVDGNFSTHPFHKPTTTIEQLVKLISMAGLNLNEIVSRIIAPAPSIKALPGLIADMEKEGLVRIHPGDAITINDTQKFKMLFPEVEDYLAVS